MKIDQRAYDKLSDDKSKLEDAYDKLVEKTQKLSVELTLSRQEVNRCHEASMKDFALIASLKNCSLYAVGVSFAISLIFGSLFMHSLIPGVDWNATLGVVIGTWWFSLFVYYGFWRAQFWN